jgi:hypothetical protein
VGFFVSSPFLAREGYKAFSNSVRLFSSIDRSPGLSIFGST